MLNRGARRLLMLTTAGGTRASTSRSGVDPEGAGKGLVEPGWSIRAQWIVYAGIVAGALVLAMVPTTEPYFAWFFGELNPAVMVLVAGLIGGLCLAVLGRLGGFEILRRGSTMRGIVVSLGFATALGVAIVVADLVFRYPQDLNAPMPQALAFYPSIGLVAEVIFHILPLTIVLLALLPLRGRLGMDRAVWIAIIVVALAEPTFQVFFGGGSPALAVYTWVHVFAIALLQLYVFRRYDFVSMYSLRLIYYAYWHLLWGSLRLELLF